MQVEACSVFGSPSVKRPHETFTIVRQSTHPKRYRGACGSGPTAPVAAPDSTRGKAHAILARRWRSEHARGREPGTGGRRAWVRVTRRRNRVPGGASAVGAHSHSNLDLPQCPPASSEPSGVLELRGHVRDHPPIKPMLPPRRLPARQAQHGSSRVGADTRMTSLSSLTPSGAHRISTTTPSTVS